MINDLMGGISRAIYSEFGDACPIAAAEDIRQNLRPPCFFIAAVAPSLERRLGESFRAESGFDVHYFPARDYDNAEMHAVAVRLWTCLLAIYMLDGTMLHGEEMRHQIVDGVLHFSVRYGAFLRRGQESEPMKALDMTTEIAEDG